MGRMTRTNVVIDQELVAKVMERFSLRSKRAAIDFALHAVLGDEGEPITDPWKAALELRGMWANMTDEEAREIWGDEVPDGPGAERPSRGKTR
jgi:Arc/MetJ family transcription regulator